MNESDLVDLAERLDASMERLADEVAAGRTYGRHNRQFIWALVLSVLLSIGIGAVAVTASLQAKEATSQSRRNAENAKITCEAGNEGRRLQTQLWTYVLNVSSQNPKLTEQQKAQIAQFRQYIATVYAPRDCNATPTPVATPTR